VEFWLMLACNVAIPQLLWWRRMRQHPVALFIIAVLVNVGMWLERYVIVITSLHRDFLPSSWGIFRPTFWDWSTYIGTIGLFCALMFLFLRFVPAISMSEMRHLVFETRERKEDKEGKS
jgi:molybdopterin-containing oxidoreductase family membrane subunit